MSNSILTVTDFADSYDLTILATAKSELGISDDSLNDKLTLLIHQVSNAISTICKRVFAEETVREVFRLNCSRELLVLGRRPVSSIISVVEDDVTVDSAEYELDSKPGILYRLTNSDYRQNWSANKITIIYVAGYYLLDDLPYDIEKGCLLWIKHLYEQNKRSDTLVRVEDVPGVLRKEFWDPSKIYMNSAPPPEVLALISPYIEKAIG